MKNVGLLITEIDKNSNLIRNQVYFDRIESMRLSALSGGIHELNINGKEVIYFPKTMDNKEIYTIFNEIIKMKNAYNMFCPEEIELILTYEGVYADVGLINAEVKGIIFDHPAKEYVNPDAKKI